MAINPGYQPSNRADSDEVLVEFRGADAGLRVDPDAAAAQAMGASEREQFERDLDDIARATAALRRAEPALETWSDQPVSATRKPRSVWLLVALLWLSTALVTVGAVAAITALVG